MNKTVPPSVGTAQTSPSAAWPEAVAEARASVASVAVPVVLVAAVGDAPER